MSHAPLDHSEIRAEVREDAFLIEPRFDIITRGAMIALVRWGAAALAVTHPARVKPAAECDHRITIDSPEVVVCPGCGVVLRDDRPNTSAPTGAEGAE